MADEAAASPYGTFPATYRRARLSAVCVEDGGVQTGPFGSQLHQRDYVPLGTPIITVEHLGENRIIHRDLPRVSEEDRIRLSRYSLQPGDIVFSRVGSVDLRALVRKEESGWLFSGRLLRVRPKPELVHSAYLSWFFGLPSFSEYVRKIAFGATMPSLNTKLLSDLPVYFPSIIEQRAIAHILSTLDDKIELNRRMNETLEALARAIFKSWFVDFDPVRAKLEGRQPFGMDTATAALFPDSFQDSALGKIPKGWQLDSFDEFIEILGGGTPKTTLPEYWNGDIPWFSVVDAPSSSDVFVIETAKRITHTGLENSAGSILPVGTTIITARGTVGKLALVGVPMSMNQSCYAIRPKHGQGNYFLYFLTRNATSDLQRSTHGTVFDTITRDTFKVIEVVVPPVVLSTRFDEVVSPIMQKILIDLHQSRTLAAIRDTLLPKLVSGEIRVRDAEKYLEAGT